MSSPRSYGDGAFYGRIKWARPLPFGRDVAGEVNRNVGDTLILLVEDSKCAARMRPVNETVVFRSRTFQAPRDTSENCTPARSQVCTLASLHARRFARSPVSSQA